MNSPPSDHERLLGAALDVGYATADLPGTGGQIKVEAADFEVEELPAYQPSGAGEHLMLWVEKTGISTPALVGIVALALGVRRQDIGVAGLKDSRAVTRQMVSAPASAEARLEAIDGASVRLLSAARHGNKLRTGHLRGNRFRIVVRDVVPDALARARTIADRIGRFGFPDFYGEQRFGQDGETLAHGLAALASGGRLPRKHPASRPWLFRLAISAAQSAVFNMTLNLRLERGWLTEVLDGDLMMKRPRGGSFLVEDLARERERAAAGEIVSTGPIHGSSQQAPGGAVLALENDALEIAGLSREAFAGAGRMAAGTRRANLAWPLELEIRADERGLELSFELPSGVYATTLLREIMK